MQACSLGSGLFWLQPPGGRRRLESPQVKNRISKRLEDTKIKVAHAMSDLFVQRGRRMLQALCESECEPKRRAALALGTWRRKLPQLELSLTGPLTEHHG